MTVPDCHGNENRLSDCPALTRPNTCIHYLAKVDCSQCTEVPAHLISPTPSTIPPSSSSSVVTSPLNSGLTLDPHPSPSPTYYDTTSQISHTLTLEETDTSSSPHPSPSPTYYDTTSQISHTLTLEETDTSSSPQKTNIDGTRITSTHFTFNAEIIIGVTMAIVVVGCVVSILLICRCALQHHYRKITMQLNEAYVDAKKIQPTRFRPKPSPMTTTIVPEPIYEQIDSL